MYRLDDPHSILRDRLLGFEAKQVIDAEFREVQTPPSAPARVSRLDALKDWIRRSLTGA